MPPHPTPGVLEVITGPMFSGKSEELIRRLKRARIARQRVACYKPDIDLRYHRTAIASHSSQTHDAVTVATVELLREDLSPQLAEVEVVGIDEVQFFSDDIIPLARRAHRAGQARAHGRPRHHLRRRALRPRPRTSWPSPTTSPSSRRSAWSAAQPAIHTQRLGHSQELVVVGAAGLYEARCRACFQPFVDEPAEQMELPAAH